MTPNPNTFMTITFGLGDTRLFRTEVGVHLLSLLAQGLSIKDQSSYSSNSRAPTYAIGLLTEHDITEQQITQLLGQGETP